MKTYGWIAKVATFIERLDAHLGVRGHAINTLTFKVEEKFLHKYADNDWANRRAIQPPLGRWGILQESFRCCDGG